MHILGIPGLDSLNIFLCCGMIKHHETVIQTSHLIKKRRVKWFFFAHNKSLFLVLKSHVFVQLRAGAGAGMITVSSPADFVLFCTTAEEYPHIPTFLRSLHDLGSAAIFFMASAPDYCFISNLCTLW